MKLLRKLHTSDDNDFLGYAESRVGGREENQDSYSYAQTRLGFLVTVCDGMGGGPGGKTASSIAVTEIVNAVNEAAADDNAEQVVEAAVKRANESIYKAGQENQKLRGMGSTATVLLLHAHSAIVAHVGDSRVYQFRGHQKIFRTFDHSMVFEMVRQKIITEEQARLSAQSNVITRALGIGPEVEVEVSKVPYERGDRFMLCTDGIHGTMCEKELIKLATESKTALGAVVDNIATIVDETGRKEGGGHDNLTLALVVTKKDSKLKQPMSRKTKRILQALGALLVLSVLLNVALFAKRGGEVETKTVQVVDTTAVRSLEQTRDSLMKNCDSLKNECRQLCDSISRLNNEKKEEITNQ